MYLSTHVCSCHAHAGCFTHGRRGDAACVAGARVGKESCLRIASLLLGGAANLNLGVTESNYYPTGCSIRPPTSVYWNTAESAKGSSTTMPVCSTCTHTEPAEEPRPECFEKGFDYYSNDLLNPGRAGTLATSPDACQSKCRSNPQCGFFTFKLERCFLKSSLAGRRFVGGNATSGPKHCGEPCCCPVSPSTNVDSFGKGTHRGVLHHVPNVHYMSRNLCRCEDPQLRSTQECIFSVGLLRVRPRASLTNTIFVPARPHTTAHDPDGASWHWPSPFRFFAHRHSLGLRHRVNVSAGEHHLQNRGAR